MDMKTYLQQASPDDREALASSVESSVGYFYLIAGGHRKASSGLCKKLVAAEPKLTLDELRPDIWGEDSPKVRRRSTDPEPPPGRAGRNPASSDRMMTASTDQPMTYKRAEAKSAEPKPRKPTRRPLAPT